MIHVTGLASYVIYREHKIQMKSKDHRNDFFLDLAKDLLYASVQSTKRVLTNCQFLYSAIEMVVERNIITTAALQAPSRGCTLVVRRCFISMDQIWCLFGVQRSFIFKN